MPHWKQIFKIPAIKLQYHVHTLALRLVTLNFYGFPDNTIP